METVEQVNQDFNVKKSKKKGLIIGGIVAVAIVVALVLVYFLVLTNPKFIFSKTIDKLFEVDSENYDSVKFDTKIKASVELEDTTYQAQLDEIEKYAIKVGTQLDAESKQEIVDLGLEYDNEAVIDARVYYNDGDMYAYFEGLFDKYIEIDMDEETKAGLDEVFESATSEENLKNTEKAVAILRDELKAQIKEEGEFEKDKTTIDVGEDDVKVTKSTVTLSEEGLCNVAANMFSKLAENEEFLDCFEDEELEDGLKELAELIEENKTEGKGNVKISLYTKGLLNKLVAVDVQIYVPEEETTVTISVIKEDEGIYTYNISGKASGIKIDVVKGKVEIQKDKDSKKEQSGKTIITADIIELGSAKLEIDYSTELNKGIDKIDTANSVNINNLTEADMQSIMEKLMERPLIGELIKQEMNDTLFDTAQDAADKTEEMIQQESALTTTQNEVKDEDFGSVIYSVPTGFEYESDYSEDEYKFYNYEDADYSYIDATVSLDWYTEADYIEDEINWDYDYYTENTDYYKNVNLSETKTIVVGDKSFKYVVLSYETTYDTKNQDAYVWYVLDNEYMFTVKLEGEDKEITEDIIKGFLNINIAELN